MVILSIALVIAGGLAMAVQSPTNTALSSCVGNFQAATMSFAGGTLVLGIASLLAGTGDFALIVQTEPWQLLGGFYGAFVVLMVTFAAPALGIAMTLTVIMIGQLIMGTIIDGFGLLGTAQMAITPLRICGCMIAAAGIIFVYIGKQSSQGEHVIASSKSLLIVVLCFISGVLGAMQTPTNASLSCIVGNLESSEISFFGGFLVLLIMTLIMNKGRIIPVRNVGIRPWMLLGGVYGAFGVFNNIIANPHIGVVLVTVSSMFGQLGGAIFVDQFGLLQAPKIKMNVWRYAGVLLTAAGVALVSIAKMI